MFSSVSFGEWTKVGTVVSAHTLYVDFERIRIHNDHTYFWYLLDSIEPPKHGILSAMFYSQTDCKEFRMRNLQYVFYKQAMGEGSGDSHTIDEDWQYPIPNSTEEAMIELVCGK